MNVAMYSAKPYEQPFFDAANAAAGHSLKYLPVSLSATTAELAHGCEAVSLFVGDDACIPALDRLHKAGVRLLALRSAGFNHVDIPAAMRLGLTVLRVPAYSPHAIAEHSVALMMTLNRKIHRAFNRTREQNFELTGLMGFDMFGKTVGIVGTGRIGEAACVILRGFGCRVLAHDPVENPACLAMGVRYVTMDELLASSSIISLHCPLTPATKHLIGVEALAKMRPDAMLINTSRGGVVDTRALIQALKRGRIGSVGLDVYEEEGDLFFHDLSEKPLQDDVFARLMSFPNVLITAHQGFFTREAMDGIARTTIANVSDFAAGHPNPENLVGAHLVAPIS